MTNYPDSFVYEIVIGTKPLSTEKYKWNCVIFCQLSKSEIIESKPELDTEALVSIAV